MATTPVNLPTQSTSVANSPSLERSQSLLNIKHHLRSRGLLREARSYLLREDVVELPFIFRNNDIGLLWFLLRDKESLQDRLAKLEPPLAPSTLKLVVKALLGTPKKRLTFVWSSKDAVAWVPATYEVTLKRTASGWKPV